MADHAIMETTAVASQKVDAWNRSAVAEVDLDNGNVVALLTKTGEVWNATVPATGSLVGLWMVSEDEIPETAEGYKGLNPNIRAFYVKAGKVFSCFKLQVGDIVTLTAEALAGTKGANTFVNATDTTGGEKLEWGATQTASVTSLKLLRSVNLAHPLTGAIGDKQRLVAYEFEVLAN